MRRADVLVASLAARCLGAGLLVLAAASCAARGGLALPDAAAIAAAGRARAAFESERALYSDERLAEALGRIAEPAFEAALAALDPSRSAPAASEGWRLVLLDEAEPEAVLFADRSLFLSRGALVALGGPASLEALMGEAASRFGGGSFRAGHGEALVEQPLRLPLGEAVTGPRTDGAPPPEDGRAAWMDLLAGLVYGERPEFGAAVGSRLLFPSADLLFALPAGRRFLPDGRRRFRAPLGSDAEPDPVLTARELPLAEGEPPVDGSLASERDLVRRLAARLLAEAEAAGQGIGLVEVVRVGGFFGVRARRADAGAGSGLVAVLRAPGAWIELAADCGEVSFGACEETFLGVLETADRLWEEPAPGPLRLRLHSVERSGRGRDVIGRLAHSGDVPASDLLRVNHAWLDRELEVGDHVFVLERDAGPDAPPPKGSPS